MYPEVYEKYVVYDNGRNVLYVVVIHVTGPRKLVPGGIVCIGGLASEGVWGVRSCR